MEKDHINELLKKYRLNQCTDREKAVLESWYIQQASSDSEPLPEIDFQFQFEDLWQRINNTIPAAPVKTSLWPRLIAAAVVVTVIGATLFYYNVKTSEQDQYPASKYANDVAPGKTGATLTLANGEKIRLSTAVNGQITQEGGVMISKSADGKLLYEISDNEHETNKINLLSTAKGETYEVRLPDGSVVILNAESSLEYPANFAKQSDRRVKLTGEGYFEIARDKMHPFVVVTRQQDVKVLGTHFNIKAYNDEAVIKTTLLEGRVQVSASNRGNAVLSPGEQSILDQKALKVKTVDIESAVAWKNGYYHFKSESIPEIMQQLTRWYDIEVVYSSDLPESTLTGTMSRLRNISQVLKMLEKTKEVHFKLEGRKVFVSR